MKFSIIIPIYNKFKYLRRCFDSILNQAILDWECLLIDDGSIDGSGVICDEYVVRDSRFRAFHTTNSGVSAARNIGLDKATGEYILFIDPDDWVTENYLDVIEKEIEGFDLLVFSNSVCYNSGGKNHYYLPQTKACEHIAIEKCIYSLKTAPQGFEFFGYIWNKCYRRKIIETNHIRFCTDLSFREDNIFNEHYYCQINSINAISDILYHYSFSETGLTHKVVTQVEYQILAREYNNLLGNTRYEALTRWNTKRSFYFMINSSLPSFHTPIRSYKETRRFVRSHPELADSIKYKCFFLSSLPIGLPIYYILEGTIFLKNSLKRRLSSTDK